jgi:ribosome biogenesis protein NSA1
MSDDLGTFSYGGDDVDISVWNTELAFSSNSVTTKSTDTPTSKKRKRGDTLFPGEIWRAKNVIHNCIYLSADSLTGLI